MTDMNYIFEELGASTTTEINSLIESVDRVLMITFRTDKNIYTDDCVSLISVSYFDTLELELPKKCIIDFSKFFYLTLQGYIKKKMYDLIIIRSDFLNKEFATAFKFFYLTNNKTFSPKVVAYLKTIEPVDSLILGALQPKKDETINAVIHVITPSITDEIAIYMTMKASATKLIDKIPGLDKKIKAVNKIEMVSYKEAQKYIKNILNQIEIETFEIPKLEDVEKLLRNHERFEKIQFLMKESAIFLVTEEKLIFRVLSNENLYDASTMTPLQLKEGCNHSVLVYYDDLLIEKNLSYLNYDFKEVIVLHDNTSDYDFYSQLLLYKDIIKKTEENLINIEKKSRAVLPGETSNKQKNFRQTILSTNNCSIDSESITAGTKYVFATTNDYITPEIGSVIPENYSFQLLNNFLYLAIKTLKKNYLHVINYDLKKTYKVMDDSTYACYITLPRIHTSYLFGNEFFGKAFESKKNALSDVAKQLLLNLYEEKLCDEHFTPIESEFIEKNQKYHEFVKEAYSISNSSKKFLNSFIEKAIENIPVTNKTTKREIIEDFIKNHRISMTEIDKSYINISNTYRDQPKCLSSFQKTYHCYSLIHNNINFGILCGKSFEGETAFKGVKGKYLGATALKSEELEIIIKYQVIYFGLSFKVRRANKENSRKYCYFTVPLKNNTIDWELLIESVDNFILGSVYEYIDSDIVKKNILLDPFLKTQYAFSGKCDKPLNSQTDGMSYKKHIETLYKVKLINTDDNNSPLFVGRSISKKGEKKKTTILSTEIIQLTSINKKIISEFLAFEKCFYAFESMALANEFKESLKLNISLAGVCMALSTPGLMLWDTKICNYERLEFLGDSVLKFAVTKHLFTTDRLKVGVIVSSKDDLIKNDNLFSISNDIELKRYFSLQGFSRDLFQPPNISFLNEVEENSRKEVVELLKFFNAEIIFENTNQHAFFVNLLSKMGNETNKARKVYADVIEALIGVHYYEYDFETAEKFIKDIKILDEAEPVNVIPLEYRNVVPLNDLKAIEEILGYTFKNIGWLETAIVHPSYSNNLFGSTEFQRIEVLGDCAIDLLITKYLYNNFSDIGPSELHKKRKELVNNHTFSRILYKTNLVSYCKIGFSDDEIQRCKGVLDNNNGFVSKVYSDLFETMVGAIILDCGYDLKKFEVYFHHLLSFMKENSYDC